MADPHEDWVRRRCLALLTDLYQLTMVAGYLKTGIHQRRAAFEYFFRELPPDTGFGIFAGLEQLLEGIEGMRFSESDLAYLKKEVGFDDEVLAYFASFRPDLDVFAVAEGTPVFPYEPVVRVEGSLAAAQLIETFLLNSLNYPTLVATKAARVVLAAEGDPVLEFGLRRAQGPDGGLTGARAAYIGGCGGTSNVLAGKYYGIPVRGTHAHSWVMSHESELAAFRAYARIFPDSCLLLVDTYDTLGSGIPNAVRVFKELRELDPNVRAAIRIDSGDLAKLSKEAFRQFQAAGFENPIIVGSNDLDVDLIADLKRQGAKVNSWGVGTNLITSRDHPALGGVYKVVAVEVDGKWKPRMKVAGNPEKTTDPHRKQVARLLDADGRPVADIMLLCDENLSAPLTITGVDRERFHLRRAFKTTAIKSLLVKVMENGRRVSASPSLAEARERALASISKLPEEMKRLRNPDVYPVLLSERLAREKETLLSRGAGND